VGWNSGIVHSIDFLSDIALVKIDTSEGDELQVARFGSSSDTRVGEFVIALGSPLFLR
jgi:S1-C subfamily serine protease